MSRLGDLTKVSTTIRSTGSGLRLAGKVLLGASVISALFGVSSFVQAYGAEKQLEFRKSQLKLPVYKLTEEQMVNPPWNHDNLDTWLYRRVEVVGRPIIRQAMNIPRMDFNCPGYEQVVPLVTREDKNYQNRSGLLFSLGFVPIQHTHPTVRHRIERVDRQKFVGFVSKMDQLKNKSLLQGNAYQPGRLKYTCSDLEDMAKSSELLNQKEAAVAVVERLAQTGRVDQRHNCRRGCDAQMSEPFPWAKTEAGALQMDKMPWDHRNDGFQYFLLSGMGLFATFTVS